MGLVILPTCGPHRAAAYEHPLALGHSSSPESLLERQHARPPEEISQQAEEVPLDQRRGAGQVRSVSMEVDGIRHGPSLMAHELGAVLRCDDAHRVGGEALA